MRMRRAIMRRAPMLVGVAVLCAVAGSSVLAYPQPLFSYHVEHGRLQLWSDRPFDPDRGRRVLADVERLIALREDCKAGLMVAVLVAAALTRQALPSQRPIRHRPPEGFRRPWRPGTPRSPATSQGRVTRRPGETKLYPWVPCTAIITASTTGSSIVSGDDQSTMKLAPIPPRTSSWAITTCMEANGFSATLGERALDHSAGLVAILDRVDHQEVAVGGVVDRQQPRKVEAGAAAAGDHGRMERDKGAPAHRQ